jgi:hypothetical protein
MAHNRIGLQTVYGVEQFLQDELPDWVIRVRSISIEWVFSGAQFDVLVSDPSGDPVDWQHFYNDLIKMQTMVHHVRQLHDSVEAVLALQYNIHNNQIHRHEVRRGWIATTLDYLSLYRTLSEGKAV